MRPPLPPPSMTSWPGLPGAWHTKLAFNTVRATVVTVSDDIATAEPAGTHITTWGLALVHKRIVEASFSVVSPPPTITLYVQWYYQESATQGPVLSSGRFCWFAGTELANFLPEKYIRVHWNFWPTTTSQRIVLVVGGLLAGWLIRRKASPESSSDILQWFYSSVYVGGTDRMTGLVWGPLCVHFGAIWSTYRIKQKIEKRTWPATLW